MAEIGEAWLSIIPSAKGFGRKLESDVGRESNGVGKKVGASFGKAFALGAGVIAAAGIGSFLKDSIEEAREAQKVGAATEAIIKATGKAANLTADQVGNLSGKLSAKIGVDDEVIQSGANILLTFKAVRDELGKGNDVFTRATAAGADLAAAGFGSIESNAKSLGKALNDPLKGITALTKSGVTFTDQQKEQIKTMVESGNVLGAQKIILGEIEKQVGGVAAATATSGEKFAVAFGNLKEAVGTALLPVLEKLFNKVLIPGITAVTDAFEQGGLAGVVELVRDKIVEALPVIRDTLMSWGRAFWEWLKDVVPPLLVQLGIVLTALGGWLLNTALPFLVDKLLQWGKAFVEWIIPLIPPMLEKLGELTGIVFNWLIDTGLPLLITKLGEWGKALVAWIGPQIPPLLLELGRLIGELGIWILTVGLPKWYGFLLGLGKALIEWIAPQIPGLLEKLGEFIVAAALWIVNTGLPKLGDAASKWGKALIEWVVPRIPGALEELGKFIGKVAVWIVTQGAPALVVATGSLGLALVKWVAPQAAKVTIELGKFMGRLTTWLLTEGLPALVIACSTMGAKGFGALLQAALSVTVSLTTFVASIPGRVASALGDLGQLLFGQGAKLVEGLIRGIESKAGELANKVAGLATILTRHFPGSPVKDGPLKSWNDGKGGVSAAGRRLVDGITQGLGDGIPKLLARINEIGRRLLGMADSKLRTKLKGQLDDLVDKFKDATDKILDGLKSKRDDIKGVLDGLKSDFASLSDSVAGAFTGNLFEATNSSDFIKNLASKGNELFKLKAAFKKLLGFGVSPAFLSQLFQSGNIPLILDLANGDKNTAVNAGNIFSDTQSLADSLGNRVAQADIGPDIRRQTAVLEEMNARISRLAKEFGREINQAATAGKKGRVAA